MPGLYRKSPFNSVFSWLFVPYSKWVKSLCTFSTQKLHKSFVIWYKTTYVRSDTCTFTYKPEWHTNTSVACLWIQLARSLSFSHTDITSAPVPVLWMQHGRDSTQTEEWSQQTCRSLLLRSAKTPLLQGGLRVSSRDKVKTFFSQTAPGLTQTFLLGSWWDGATHWAFFLSCCNI